MKGKAYWREYLRNYEPSESADEWDDRNRLYSIKTTLINSASFVGTNVRLKLDGFSDSLMYRKLTTLFQDT